MLALSLPLAVGACALSDEAPDAGEATRPGATTPRAATCSGYSVTVLGILPGGISSQASALDSSGVVAGSSQTAASFGPQHAFRWTAAGGQVDLGTLGGSYSFAYSNAGTAVVGQSELASGAVHAFRADASGIHDLGTLGATGIYDRSEARGINASGVAVGASRLPNGFERAVRFSGGTVTDLGTLVGGPTANSRAHAINAAGRIVGQSDRPGGQPHAAAWQGGAITDLGALTPTGTSVAHAVNAAGDAAGQASLTSAIFHPVVFRGGAVLDLGLPVGFESGTALGINAAGHVVGNVNHRSGEIVSRHGFLYDGVSIRDINTLGVVGDWEITSASAINDAGQIAAAGASTAPGMGQDRRTKALLLTPICGETEDPHLRSISTATNSATVPAPDDIEAGDLLVAAFEYCAHPVAFTPPAGWTKVADQISGAGTDQVFHALVYTRVATASEPADYAFTAPPGVYVSSQVAAYAGVSTVGQVASTQAFGTSIAAPSVTTTGPGQLLVVVFTDFVYGAWSTAAGLTQQSDFDSNSLQDELRPAAGPTGTRTATNSAGALSAISLRLQ